MKTSKATSRALLSLILSFVVACTMMPTGWAEQVNATENADSSISEELQTEDTEYDDSEEAEDTDSEESDIDTSSGKEYTYTYINPIYSDVISEEDLVEPDEDSLTDAEEDSLTETGEDGKLTTYGVSSKKIYTSIASAAKVLRSGMKDRKKTISLYYKRSKMTGKTWISILNKAIVHTGNSTEGDYLARHYAGCKVQYKYTSSACKITYTMTYYTSAKQEAAVTKKLKTVYSNLGLSKMSDDYDRISAIYQYITENVTYDYDALNGKKGSSYKLQYTAYGALVKGTAVCQGYANLVYRMMLDNGIDTRIISHTGVHGWNIVKIGSTYYNVDATWDAGRKPANYRYFLKCNANFTDSVHTRSSEYNTASFNKTYPMSSTDYASHDHSYTKAPTFKWKKDSYGGYSSCKAVFTCTGCKTTSSSKCSVSTSLSGGKVKYVAKVTRAGKSWTSSARYSTLKFSQSKSGLIVTGASTKKITSVNIPATVKIAGTKYKVVAIKKNAFKKYTKIKKVTIGSNVKNIGNNAFYKCTSLKKVNAKSTALTKIGKNAFSGDKKMTKAVFSSKKLTKIGSKAFYGCKKLSSVTFKTKKLSSKRIGSKAFKGIKKTCKFKVPSSKRTAYKKLFKKKGASKKIRVVK